MNPRRWCSSQHFYQSFRLRLKQLFAELFIKFHNSYRESCISRPSIDISLSLNCWGSNKICVSDRPLQEVPEDKTRGYRHSLDGGLRAPICPAVLSVRIVNSLPILKKILRRPGRSDFVSNDCWAHLFLQRRRDLSWDGHGSWYSTGRSLNQNTDTGAWYVQLAVDWEMSMFGCILSMEDVLLK